MPSPHPLSVDQIEALLSAIQAERLHLLLVGAERETLAVVSTLGERLAETTPVALTVTERQALAQTRSWLRSLEGSSRSADGWCPPDDRARQPIAVVALTDGPLQEIGSTRHLLGQDTLFIIAIREECAQRDRPSILEMLGHQVLEVQITPPERRGTQRLGTARLEAALVVLILTLVGLSTLWLTDKAVSEPMTERPPSPVWSVRK